MEKAGDTDCVFGVSAAEGVWRTSIWQFQSYRKDWIPILFFGSADEPLADEETFFLDMDGSDNFWQLAAGKTCCMTIPCAAPYDKSFCRNNYKAREVIQSYPFVPTQGFPHVGIFIPYGALAVLTQYTELTVLSELIKAVLS